MGCLHHTPLGMTFSQTLHKCGMLRATIFNALATRESIPKLKDCYDKTADSSFKLKQYNAQKIAELPNSSF